MFVDSHCHLSFPGLHERIADVRREMALARVDRAICICTTLEEFETVHALACEHAELWCTAGVHPDNEGVREPTADDLLEPGFQAGIVDVRSSSELLGMDGTAYNTW